MRRGLVVGLTVLAAASGRPARATSSLDETVEGVKELTAPAGRTELRFDLGSTMSRDQAASRTEVRVEIAPRPDFWYGLGVSSIEKTTVTSSVSTSAPNAPPVVTSTATTSDGLALSARVFKRVGPLVLSAGLVDNRGGAGVELRGLADRLRLEALVSEWSARDPAARPTLRVGGSAQWWQLYVQAGVADAVERPVASLYVGAGLRWTDGDFLRALWWLRH